MRRQVQSVVIIAKAGTNDNCWAKFANYWGCRCTMLHWAMIGTMLGALLGIGSTAVAFMSDANAKASSKDSEDFGKGSLLGIAATKPADSAIVCTTLIPLRSPGIPSRVAMIISAFTIHCLSTRPLLCIDQSWLIYGLFMAIVMAHVITPLID